MLIDLTFETIKFIITQSKKNLQKVNFTKLNVGEHKSINDSSWNYWVFDAYDEMVSWAEVNLPEITIPPENMM